MARLVAQNMLAMLKGERPANVYNHDLYERIAAN